METKGVISHQVANFNSIKVQLERGGAGGAFLATLFQFHKGTIRTVTTTLISP